MAEAANQSSAVSRFGLVLVIALGVWVLNEPLNIWIGAGTLLVLSGVFIVSKYGTR